ncbi:MAG: hypothetical protein K2M05_03220 [Paramuribaculum sp.]|nr:hypothetical protein [Paramuribaculum sp.]
MKVLNRIMLLGFSFSLLMVSSVYAADQRDNRRERTERSATRSTRSNQTVNSSRGSSTRTNNQSGLRPGAANNKHDSGKDKHDTGLRPGQGNNNNNNNSLRPGQGNNNNNNNNGHKPGQGNNNNNGHKPGQNNDKFRPGAAGNHNNHGNRPGHSNGPHGGPNPGHGFNPPAVRPPSHHPARPMTWHYAGRPTPPPSWRPNIARPLFSTMLGLAFNTTINVSINTLINNGYNVDGYDNNTVFINDVRQLGMLWPYASLYYNNAGLLTAGEFVYSTIGYNTSRYYSAYNQLCSLYGPPVSVNNYGQSLSATWWGPHNQYVSLNFDFRQPVAANFRYYTTLTFGI